MTHQPELLSAYLDGELRDGELADLLEHLSGCGECASELDELHRVRAAVRSLPMVEMPVGLLPEAETEVVPLTRRRGVWLGAAAAVVAVVLALATILTPEPAAVSVDDLNSRFGARVTLDPSFGPAKIVPPDVVEVGN